MSNIELAKEIAAELSKLEYKSHDSKYMLPVIRKGDLPTIQEVILSMLNDNYSHDIGILQAKVKFYEEMISKSNFAPFCMMGEKLPNTITMPQDKGADYGNQ